MIRRLKQAQRHKVAKAQRSKNIKNSVPICLSASVPDRNGFIFLRNPQSGIRNESGMALIVVVAIVAILSAIGITFMYEMRMEEKAAFNYVNSLKASYIAKSGIEHAIALLKSDGGDTGYDAYSERWGYDTTPVPNISVFGGSEVNLDDTTVTNNLTDGNESKWLYVTDDNGDTVGRYAVLIIDESSKININTVGYSDSDLWDNSSSDPRQGWGPFEISLKDFFQAGYDQLGWRFGSTPSPQEQTLATNIVNYRYGPDGKPGIKDNLPTVSGDDNADSIILEHDGIDNNANGIIDESGEGVDDPYEFVLWDQYGDDSPFITDEEIKNVTGIGTTIFDDIKPYITVYSSDENTNDSGFLRMNINLVKDATALYTVMYDAWEGLIRPAPIPLGYYSYDDIRRLAAQCAVNTIDYADTDNVSTFLEIINTDVVGNETTIAHGVEGIRFNEIMVKPAYQLEAENLFKNRLEVSPKWSTDYGDTFICSKTPSDIITANIKLNRKGSYRLRVLSYDDCTYDVSGRKATNVVGNTLFDTGPPFLNWTLGEWIKATITIVSGSGAGQTQWITGNGPDSVNVSGWDSVLGSPDTTSMYHIEKDNSFAVRIYDGTDKILEDTAGAHNMGGWLLEDLGIVNVQQSGHEYRIELQTSPILNRDTGARLDYIQFSQQPDCEYVELVNISNRDIDISGWTLTTSGGFVGIIPGKPATVDNPVTIIPARGYMVLTVDRDGNFKFMYDNPDVNKNANMVGYSSDDICFNNTWHIWPDVHERDKHVRALELSSDPVHIAENVLGDTIVVRGSIFEDSPLIGRDNPDTPMAITLWEGPLADRKIVAEVDYRTDEVDTDCYTYTDGTNTIHVKGFVALEKNDPTAISDWDGDGVDDYWLLNGDLNVGDSEVPDIRGGTPGGENYQFHKEGRKLADVEIRNLPFATIGDIKEVSTSDTVNEWSKIGYIGSVSGSSEDIELIKRLADKITVSEKRLEAENYTNYYTTLGSWTECPSDDTFLTPYYSTSDSDDTGIWGWGIKQRINPDTGIYDLYISGKVLKSNWDSSDTMLVRVTTWYDGGTNYGTKALSFSEDNFAYYGQIAIEGVDNSETSLQLEIWKEVSNTVNTISFDAAILAPEHRSYGVININTADTPVLQALPGITDVIANAIVDYRKGPPPHPFHTIGEILDVEDGSGSRVINLDAFSKISNLITTKSKIFTIISEGQTLRESDKGDVSHDGKTYEILGEKKYIVVTER